MQPSQLLPPPSAPLSLPGRVTFEPFTEHRQSDRPAPLAQLLVTEDSELESEDDPYYAPSLPESFKVLNLVLDPYFPGLPPKMLQILRQEGTEFKLLFERLQIQISSARDLQKLLKYF